MKKLKRIIIVSTFSGMDLLMLAFVRAWAMPGYGLEKNVWAALMHAANFHYPDGTPVMQFIRITKEEHLALKANKDDKFDSTLIDGEYIRGKRIEEANGAEVRAEIERRYGKDIFVILLGGPPCQDLCGMNRKKRQGERNRNKLLFEYARFVKELNPDVAVMEEAEELCNDKNYAPLFDELIAKLTELPFNVAHLEMNSLHYGSYQQRVRTIIMMVNKALGKMPVFPEPDEVNVKRVRDFLDIQYFHSGNFTDGLKNKGNFMCSVTSGAPDYFIRNGIKVKPTTDELLLFFGVQQGDYKIPQNIPAVQVRKAIGNAVCTALAQKLAETIFEKVLCVRHVGDNWFEPIEGNDDTPGPQPPDSLPDGPAPESGDTSLQSETIETPALAQTDLLGDGTVTPEVSEEFQDTSGYVLYQGPSAINNGNIVAIVTANSVNEKTGPMSQLWILPANTAPLEAVTTGEDEAVCGQCRLRHFLRGACYVTVAKGPHIVYKAWKNGNYPYLPMEGYNLLHGKAIRFGAYGDPAAIPFSVLEKLKKQASTATCYTHQWANEKADALKTFSMASVDNIDEYKKAAALGWRTFRIIEEDESPAEGEILCPNTTKGVLCINCGLCAGNSIKAKNIAIHVHGTHKLKFNANLSYAAWATKNKLNGSTDKAGGALVEPSKPSAVIPATIIVKPQAELKSGIRVTKRIITSDELLSMEFDTLGFTGKWHTFLGNPSTLFNAIIHGMAGEGKSTLACQLAKYLADNHGKTLYISGEEGFSKTLKDKVVLTGSSSNTLYWAELKSPLEILREIPINIYNFIFIDSLQHLNIGAQQMRELRAKYKNTAFICISQATKAGEMRGSNELAHDSDIIVKVEKGLAITTKNRFKEKGATFNVFESMLPTEEETAENNLGGEEAVNNNSSALQ